MKRFSQLVDARLLWFEFKRKIHVESEEQRILE